MMLPYGKTTQNAIAALSYLAERYGQKESISSLEIADARKISKPLVAKILTILSQAGLVKGVPGPKGGYALAKHPRAISLHDIVKEFEQIDKGSSCPFGPNWCGKQDPCPMHDLILEMDHHLCEFLKKTRFDLFVKNKVRNKK